MPYDYVVVSSGTDLSTYLSTSGTTGLYSGIVTISSTLLSGSQASVVVAYQQKFGVKWAVVGSSVTGLPGVTAGLSLSGQFFDVTLAPEFAQYAACLQPTASVNNSLAINWSGYKGVPASLTSVEIVDTTSVTPVLLAQYGSQSLVAAAHFNMSDGTEQLHYFISQNSQYIFSMVFAPVLVNWISPAKIFIGNRRLTLAIQPDDLFLASYLWDVTTHTNPVTSTSPTYRLSAQDLQNLADFFDGLNTKLPAGSHITVEWPTNFGGVNDWSLEGAADELYAKAIELKDKFLYLSHTWDHPCTLDTVGTYDYMYEEVRQNQLYLPTFFGDDLSLWSNTGMVTPCVTGLWNGPVLNAMADLGVTACVSDESITNASTVDYVPIIPYHGVYSTVELNGYAGILFVPRETLDIDYCDINPEMVVDEYNTNYNLAAAPLTFEEIFSIQTMYAIQDKIAFRHDPFMFHQANGATFLYDDPVAGIVHNVSLISLWAERVVDQLLSYYTLPLYQPKMDDLVTIFKNRLAMDECNITVTLGLDSTRKVVGVSTTGTNSCQLILSGVTLSGSSVTMETYGVETTAYINLTANTQQTFTLSTPLIM